MKRDRKRLSSIFTAVAAACVVLLGQTVEAADRAAAIERVGGDIQYLASDELEGRGPGTKGLELAAEHIIAQFKELGLSSGPKDGSYKQPFEIAIENRVVKDKTSLVLSGPDGETIELELGKDFQPLATGGSGKASAEIIFAGYGISAKKQEYDDYAGHDVEGKIVLIIRREPQQGDKESVFNGTSITNHALIRTKLQAAKKAKAAAVLLVNDPHTTEKEKKDALTRPNGFGTRGMGIPFAHVSQSIVEKLLSRSPLESGGTKFKTLAEVEAHIDETLTPLTQPLSGWTAELSCKFESVKADVANVIGVLEGKGPHADETIVIGAHYDHLGYGPFGSRRPNERAVHNGADDNATGTAAVMELARRFALRNEKPARRMVFIGFSAEERGIIGSNYYLEHPLFPLEKTVAMINFDMIGNLGEEGVILGGVNTGKEFGKLVEEANKEGFVKVKPSKSVGGSDHAGFYRKGVPVLFFFTGMTKLYHTPDDDFETINVEGVAKTIDLAESVLDEILALEKAPEYVKQKRSSRPGGGAMAYLGVVPDYAGTEAKGLRITDVNDDSPASKGGLKKGDVITKIGEVDVPDIQGLANGLRKYKAGQIVEVIVKRGEEEKKLKVKLGQPKSPK